MAILTKEQIQRIKDEVHQEFPDDEMMRELHEIRMIHNEETKDLSFEEKMRLIKERNDKFLKEQGYKLVPTRNGRYGIIKIGK